MINLFTPVTENKFVVLKTRFDEMYCVSEKIDQRSNLSGTKHCSDFIGPFYVLVRRDWSNVDRKFFNVF